MKKSLLLVMLISIGVIFTSCKKDDPVTPGDDHSSLNPEGHKTHLTDASNDVVTELETLKSSKTIDAGDAMSALMELNDPFAPGVKMQSLLKTVGDLANNPNEATALLKSLQEEGDRFVYADHVGEYAWNPTTNTWDKTTSEQIIFKFPATEGGTTNNAVLTFVSYTDQQITTNGNVDYLPTGASMNLAIDEVKELEFTMSASYKTDGMPQSVNVSIFINPFTFTGSLTNTNSVISEEFTWTVEGKNILSFGSTLNGDFSTLSTGEDSGPGDYITTGSVYLQMYDARLEGTANVTEINAYGEDMTLAELNASTTILLKWANDDVKIADGEFYEKGVEDLGIMLTFADETTADAEVFFEATITSFENFFKKVENDFGK